MSPTYDVAVLGLGAMGAAAAWQLARRGARVLGIDRHAPPHEHGSTHGDTRVTRIDRNRHCQVKSRMQGQCCRIVG